MKFNPILTKDEAEKLLNMSKSTFENEIYFPQKGEKVEFSIQSTTSKDLFSIIIFRSRINTFKYNYNLKIIKNGIIILALDITPTGKHRNPDGTILEGSHWHVYTEEYGRQYAIPAENIHADDFVENTLLFFEKINLISPPDVIYQNELIC